MAKWKNVAVKLEPDVFAELEQFVEDGGYDSIGAALRHLISHALEELSGRQGIEEKTLRENAKAAARQRFHMLLHAAVSAFDQDVEISGEGDDNVDDQFDYDE